MINKKRTLIIVPIIFAVLVILSLVFINLVDGSRSGYRALLMLYVWGGLFLVYLSVSVIISVIKKNAFSLLVFGLSFLSATVTYLLLIFLITA